MYYNGEDLNHDGFWGPEIPVNGVRPPWLSGHPIVALKTTLGWVSAKRSRDSETEASCEEWAWSHTDGNVCIESIALPSNHLFYVDESFLHEFQDVAKSGERIVAAACRKGELIISMPKPNRHHHILHAYHDLLDPEFKLAGDSGVHIRGHEQGFLTNTGRYVDRVEGLEIAERADQITEKQGNPTILFSEDMW